MCDRKKATDDAKKKPDADCKAKKDCPEDLRIRITPKKVEYVVVLDKDGNPPAAYPVLEFDITDGPPGYAVDVQVSRDAPGLLTGGPGLKDAWDKSKQPTDRVPVQPFSSHTNGDTITLDGAGKATYKMPLDWWKDQARRKRSDFTTAKMYYRALGSPSKGAAPKVWSTKDGDTAPNVPVHNNLVDFKVVDNGYIDGGITKSIRMEFTVREAGTTEMYTFVQWMQGSFRQFPTGGGAVTYPTHQLYDIIHDANFPDFTIDRLHTNPRYWDGAYNISGDTKTASATDGPNQGNLTAGFVRFYSSIDFETRVHLNFEVPASVHITRKDGSAPVFGVVSGDLSPPVPFTLDSATWNTRVLQVFNAAGSVVVTHPNTLPP
jgi:hypothetical protein